MRIAIVGGAGRMGLFFLRYFKAKGHSVVITDIRGEDSKRIAAEEGVEAAQSASDAAVGADLVVVSVPIEATPSAIAEVAPHMMRGSLLVEISSVKRGVVEALRGLEGLKVKPLSIHPLFGPGAQGLRGNRIAVIPILNPQWEAQRVQEIFGEAEIVPVDADEHDRAVALTITLPYLLNVSFASVLKGEDLSRLRELGGPSFELQLLLCEGMMSQDPHIYESILGEELKDYRGLERLQRCIATILSEASTIQGFREYVVELRAELAKDPLFREAYGGMYRALEALRER
jgi:prephenate dehydrogenase